MFVATKEPDTVGGFLSTARVRPDRKRSCLVSLEEQTSSPLFSLLLYIRGWLRGFRGDVQSRSSLSAPSRTSPRTTVPFPFYLSFDQSCFGKTS